MNRIIANGKHYIVSNRRVLKNTYIDFSLCESKNGPVFKACGAIHGHSWGQNLDSIAKKYPNDKKAREIVKVWRKYHLNDMQAGTPAQMEYLKQFKKDRLDYTQQCQKLEQVGLLIDNGYKYGSSWLYKSIPDDVIELIKSW